MAPPSTVGLIVVAIAQLHIIRRSTYRELC